MPTVIRRYSGHCVTTCSSPGPSLAVAWRSAGPVPCTSMGPRFAPACFPYRRCKGKVSRLSRACRKTAATLSSEHGWRSMCRNVVTANQDRSCPRRHCWRPIPLRVTQTSIRRFPEISAGAARTFVSEKLSIGQPNLRAKRSQSERAKVRSPGRVESRTASLSATDSGDRRRSRARAGVAWRGRVPRL